MFRSYARWRSFDAPEQRQLLELMVALPVIAALVRLLGVMRTGYLLERLSGNSASRRADEREMQVVQRLAQLVALAGRRGVISVTCLRQALLLHWLLRRRGLRPELKLGVRKQAHAFDAHAWVELQGVALGQGELTHVPFAGPRLRAPSKPTVFR